MQADIFTHAHIVLGLEIFCLFAFYVQLIFKKMPFQKKKEKYTLFLLFCFLATPVAYGSSQARGQIRAVAAGLYHSHSNTESKPCLWPIPQLPATQILNQLSKARGQTLILIVTSQIHFRWAPMGTPYFCILYRKYRWF